MEENVKEAVPAKGASLGISRIRESGATRLRYVVGRSSPDRLTSKVPPENYKDATATRDERALRSHYG